MELRIFVRNCVIRVHIALPDHLIFSGTRFCFFNCTFIIVHFTVVGDTVLNKSSFQTLLFSSGLPCDILIRLNTRVDNSHSIIRDDFPEHIVILFSDVGI